MCHYKTACAIKCSCKKTELWSSVVCLNCDLEVSENTPEVSLNNEKNEYNDQDAILLSSEHTLKRYWGNKNMWLLQKFKLVLKNFQTASKIIKVITRNEKQANWKFRVKQFITSFHLYNYFWISQQLLKVSTNVLNKI